MSIENAESKHPDNTRSPGVTDRDASLPENFNDEVEVVRRPFVPVPDVTETPAKPNTPLSEGVTDRDISKQKITASTTEETETVRKPIIPDTEAESDQV